MFKPPFFTKYCKLWYKKGGRSCVQIRPSSSRSRLTLWSTLLFFPCFIGPNGPRERLTLWSTYLTLWSTTFDPMIYLFSKTCRNKQKKVDHRVKRRFGHQQKTWKKRVARERLTLWSTYPSHSAERSVFDPKNGTRWSTFFWPKKKEVDHWVGPLDGLTLWST